MDKDKRSDVETIVKKHLTKFANDFKKKHVKAVGDPKGTINLKKQNVFIAALPSDLMFFSAFVRSFDSSFGTVLENIALEIAEGNYDVRKEVIGEISLRQLDHISDILTSYKNRIKQPEISHYENYSAEQFKLEPASHASDHLFYDAEADTYHIIELKAGGDLDIKKAEVEKRALLEQYFILKNTTSSQVRLHFGTAYNKFGEGKPWNQERVLRFFAKEELLVGKDFWNFVCKDEEGFEIVIKTYNQNINILNDAISEIKEVYSV